MSQNDEIDKDETIYNLNNKVKQVKQNYSEKENELQMQIRVLRTQIKKQKALYTELMEKELRKSKDEYQEIINEKTKLIKSLETNKNELIETNQRLEKQNDRLEIQQKASDYNEIHKSLSDRLNRVIEHMNEKEDDDDKLLLQMKRDYKDLRKESRFLKKITITAEKYSPSLKEHSDQKNRLLKISEDIDTTYKLKLKLEKVSRDLRDEKDNREEMIEELQKKNAQLQTAINQHESTIEVQKKQMDKHEVEIVRLRNLPPDNEKHKKIRELENEINNRKNNEIMLQNNIDQLEKDKLAIQERKEFYKKDIQEKQIEIDNYTQELVEKNNEILELERELLSAKKSVEHDKQELIEKLKLLNQVEAEKKRIAEENTKLVKANSHLQEQLDKAESSSIPSSLEENSPLLEDRKHPDSDVVIDMTSGGNKTSYGDPTKTRSKTKEKFIYLAVFVIVVIALLVGWILGSIKSFPGI